MPLSIVILAAGQGKRMNSDLPKVLQSLAGKPLLQHVIETARTLKPANIYVVYGHGGAAVQAAFAHQPIEWILQAEQLGTGHAVMQAMAVIPDEETVLVLYGDVPLIQSGCLHKLIEAAHDHALALLTVDLAEATGYGRILRDAKGHVSGIIEEKDASPAQRLIREANSGLMAAPAGRLREWLLDLGRDNAQREYYLTDVVAGAVRAKHAVVAIPVAHASDVLGVNDRIQLAQVEAAYRRRRAEELMLAGATLADPLRVDIRGDVTVERDVLIDANTVLIGKVHLAARVIVGPHCVIRDSRIGADTEIKANSVIEEAVVGENCRIGPFARLRPDTVLAANVHVGNFVEVKNSHIGAGSKVGAGTITCNYDGANKWPTVIDDNAFIGSGSMLVAPVRIGADATIGAGSTITASAPDGKLSLTRARQTTIDAWTRPVRQTEEERAAAIDEAGAVKKS
jgi:bifunctional UDP-N-acetylglucosamine pyrophosphorylase / glucosamine-1-phosphate N-acetyltransferase